MDYAVPKKCVNKGLFIFRLRQVVHKHHQNVRLACSGTKCHLEMKFRIGAYLFIFFKSLA